MFQIRPEQMELLRTAQLQKFEDRAVHFLHTHLPRTADVDGVAFRSMIRRQIARAERHGIVHEDEVMSFLVTACMVHEGFDVDYDEVRVMLASTETSSAEKISFLEDWTVEHLHRRQERRVS